MHKLSASALSTFLKSPKQFYWKYVVKLEPIQDTIATYAHDRLFGIVWAEVVDRFYKRISEKENVDKTLQVWLERTDDWVPKKIQDKLTNAFNVLIPQYYQLFSPDDGCRTAECSELFVENDRFLGYLDGLSKDRVIHECKTTSRAPQLSEQLWRVEHSLQIKLYAVLADATGHRVEFAWKDQPHQIFRGPVTPVTEEQKRQWETELNTLADFIYSLGDDPAKYVCTPDSCCLVTRGVVSMCQYQTLCDMGLDDTTKMLYRPKTHR